MRQGSILFLLLFHIITDKHDDRRKDRKVLIYVPGGYRRQIVKFSKCYRSLEG